MNIFISYSHRDEKIALKLSNVLSSSGFDVFIDNKIPIGGDIYREIGKNILKADALIVIVSKNSLNSFAMANEAVSYLSFMNKGAIPFVIPIIIGDDIEIPLYLKDYNCLRIPSDPQDKKLDEAFEHVKAIMKVHEQKLIENKKIIEKAEQKVKQSLSDYIQDVFVVLKRNEHKSRILSYIFYGLSILTIVSSIVWCFRFDISSLTDDIGKNTYIIFSNVFIIVLMIALTRLCFVLGKSFMVEAIRSADRTHAISFGKFFLDAFGKEANREEIIKAFSAWNIDGGSTFRTQTTDEFDPKLAEYLKVINKK